MSNRCAVETKNIFGKENDDVNSEARDTNEEGKVCKYVVVAISSGGWTMLSIGYWKTSVGKKSNFKMVYSSDSKVPKLSNVGEVDGCNGRGEEIGNKRTIDLHPSLELVELEQICILEGEIGE
eukprot:jgi/Psemu1/46685/gm1.46685_g